MASLGWHPSVAEMNFEGRHCEVAVRIRLDTKSEDHANSEGMIKWEEKGSYVMTSTPPQKYTFDYVFGPTASQEEVYTSCLGGLVDSFFKGYNCCVMTYGQTGAGKTFTMGSSSTSSYHDKSRGILPRAFEEILINVERMKTEGTAVDLNVSFVEIYNEELRDLLDDGASSSLPKSSCTPKSIRVTEDPVSKAICVIGVTRIHVSSVGDLLHCLNQGAASRVTASNSVNSSSSRSHAIFTLAMSRGSGDLVTTSKFHFVDLAGSERVKKTGAEGYRLREGIHINTGLLALSNVINILSSESYRLQPSAHHVPYRDSKLTRILQDSLGGNSRTIMIACVNASPKHLLETQSTIKYAARARNIQNIPIVNENPHVALVESYQRQIDDLSSQILYLNEKQNSLLKELMHKDSLVEILKNGTKHHQQECLYWRDACQRFCQLFSESVCHDSQGTTSNSTTKPLPDSPSPLEATDTQTPLTTSALQKLSHHVAHLQRSLESKQYLHSQNANSHSSDQQPLAARDLSSTNDHYLSLDNFSHSYSAQTSLATSTSFLYQDNLAPDFSTLSMSTADPHETLDHSPFDEHQKIPHTKENSDGNPCGKDFSSWDTSRQVKRIKKEFTGDREDLMMMMLLMKKKKKNFQNESGSKLTHGSPTGLAVDDGLRSLPSFHQYQAASYSRSCLQFEEEKRSHERRCVFFKKALDRIQKTILSKLYLLNTTRKEKMTKDTHDANSQTISCDGPYPSQPVCTKQKMHPFFVWDDHHNSLLAQSRQDVTHSVIPGKHKKNDSLSTPCSCVQLEGCTPLDEIFNDWIVNQYDSIFKKTTLPPEKSKFFDEASQLLLISCQELKEDIESHSLHGNVLFDQVIFELLVDFSWSLFCPSTAHLTPSATLVSTDQRLSNDCPSLPSELLSAREKKRKDALSQPKTSMPHWPLSYSRSRHRCGLTLIPIPVFVSMALKFPSRSMRCLAFLLRHWKSTRRLKTQGSAWYRPSFHRCIPDGYTLMSSSDSARSSLHLDPYVNETQVSKTSNDETARCSYPFHKNASSTLTYLKRNMTQRTKLKHLLSPLQRKNKKAQKETFLVHRKEKKCKHLFTHLNRETFVPTLKNISHPNKGTVTVDGVRFLRNYGSDDNADAAQSRNLTFTSPVLL